MKEGCMMKKRRRNPPYQLRYVDMIASAVKKWRALSRNDKILVAQLAQDNRLIMLIPQAYLDEIGFRGNPVGRCPTGLTGLTCPTRIRTPSLKKIESELGDILRHEYGESRGPAGAIKDVMERTGRNRSVERSMDRISDLLKGYGVEAIRGDTWEGSFWTDCVALYVNMGDTYVPTVLYDVNKDVFRVTSWGDWVEINQRKYGIQ
jgi:hypothetical protein